MVFAAHKVNESATLKAGRAMAVESKAGGFSMPPPRQIRMGSIRTGRSSLTNLLVPGASAAIASSVSR